MSDTKAYRFIVKGRVQGVGFRWYVVNEANQLNVAGTVKNRDDGSVEVFVQGSMTNIYTLKNLLKKGPSFSRVDIIVESEDVYNDKIKEFRVIY